MARERLGLPASKLRERRRRRAYLRNALWVVAVLALVGGVVGLTHLPALQVRTVSVVGLSTVPSDEVAAVAERELRGRYLYLISKRNIFLYPRESIASAVAAAFPKLNSVAVSFKDLASIEIQAAERDPAALWCDSVANDSCYLLDEDGYIFAPAPEFSGVVYVRYLGTLSGAEPLRSSYLTPEAFRRLSSLVAALAARAQDEPGEVRVEDGDVTLAMLEGYDVRFTLAEEPAEVVKRLELALQADSLRTTPRASISYIDLRFGNRLYFKLK